MAAASQRRGGGDCNGGGGSGGGGGGGREVTDAPVPTALLGLHPTISVRAESGNPGLLETAVRLCPYRRLAFCERSPCPADVVSATGGLRSFPSAYKTT